MLDAEGSRQPWEDALDPYVFAPLAKVPPAHQGADPEAYLGSCETLGRHKYKVHVSGQGFCKVFARLGLGLHCA